MQHRVGNVVQEGPLFNEDGSPADDILAGEPEVLDNASAPGLVDDQPVIEKHVNSEPPKAETPPNGAKG